MGANDLITQLRESGFSIGLMEDRLQIAPAELLTNELKQTIRQSKPEILAALQIEVYESALAKATLVESVKNGGTCWMWQINMLDRTLIVTTTPASTKAEMEAMYPAAIRIEVVE